MLIIGLFSFHIECMKMQTSLKFWNSIGLFCVVQKVHIHLLFYNDNHYFLNWDWKLFSFDVSKLWFFSQHNSNKQYSF
jgi:hypothetical protein